MKIDKRLIRKVKARLERNGDKLLHINIVCENGAGYNNGDITVEFMTPSNNIVIDTIGNIYD